MDNINEELKEQKVIAIQQIIDIGIKNFAEGFENRHILEVDNPEGVINSKKNNVFISELGEEFIFYSAFVRSFDSSFGRVLENIGNSIAHLSYEVRGKIESYILPQQNNHIDILLESYVNKSVPNVLDYANFQSVMQQNVESYRTTHETDNYFYCEATRKHFIIELKAGGDLDNKKAQAEKKALLKEYFLLKNQLVGTGEEVKIYFATAYNKFGEGNEWSQPNVRNFFADDELLIGKDYWNFVCDSEDGFKIVFEQYKRSCHYIIDALERIKILYFNEVEFD